MILPVSIIVAAILLVVYSRNKMLEVKPLEDDNHPYEDVAPETHVQYKKD
jgi:hypothetical protein